ncbi:hypothetical protein [Chroogloeocystis siderophila]|jgi:hypothetical protein|uniref:Uncharacterized protein n=1 Tax=Chroogloeocystis siderophila 5.2 s.c.1 TaxID=247279 RepID=A0A1U7HS03_9CHRO|nr:hypothetical protein [Chroogloeocystis siderophila]OKH26314.1 hypothetical protein NIES1031_11115 [Chroogloeocystis siderophila 5.2 s.c.1]
MDAFAPVPPEWTHKAIHAYEFCCPTCRASSRDAENVWLNRRSPVMTDNYRRKWQEFYQCRCGCVWWAWSSDRPPSEFSSSEQQST